LMMRYYLLPARKVNEAESIQMVLALMFEFRQ